MTAPIHYLKDDEVLAAIESRRSARKPKRLSVGCVKFCKKRDQG
jgi:hypothetical protein